HTSHIPHASLKNQQRKLLRTLGFVTLSSYACLSCEKEWQCQDERLFLFYGTILLEDSPGEISFIREFSPSGWPLCEELSLHGASHLVGKLPLSLMLSTFSHLSLAGYVIPRRNLLHS